MISFNINPSSGLPIYKQICEQLERMILNNHLAANAFVPSVRQLAVELEVNPMTISKAYSLLEERGLLTRQRGKGMKVAARDTVKIQSDILNVISQSVEKVIIEANQMGITRDELARLFNNKLTQLHTDIKRDKSQESTALTQNNNGNLNKGSR
ncbi:GntR family transcriptional regulator [Algibacillus agarilyticus]|uniref:GntR family transcriptional regulator n=1 Tax=Algibacillus agarilyticus TaxID=2234133 RepID=UPI000DD0ABB8|nr:GntR family transcriptional regulator [Algibacillus agarilyticus]